ncbi:MAG: hypothetical protein ACC662_11410, partial [Planctomycetota bacterium]
MGFVGRCVGAADADGEGRSDAYFVTNATRLTTLAPLYEGFLPLGIYRASWDVDAGRFEVAPLETFGRLRHVAEDAEGPKPTDVSCGLLKAGTLHDLGTFLAVGGATIRDSEVLSSWVRILLPRRESLRSFVLAQPKQGFSIATMEVDEDGSDEILLLEGRGGALRVFGAGILPEAIDPDRKAMRRARALTGPARSLDVARRLGALGYPALEAELCQKVLEDEDSPWAGQAFRERISALATARDLDAVIEELEQRVGSAGEEFAEERLLLAHYRERTGDLEGAARDFALLATGTGLTEMGRTTARRGANRLRAWRELSDISTDLANSWSIGEPGRFRIDEAGTIEVRDDGASNAWIWLPMIFSNRGFQLSFEARVVTLDIGRSLRIGFVDPEAETLWCHLWVGIGSTSGGRRNVAADIDADHGIQPRRMGSSPRTLPLGRWYRFTLTVDPANRRFLFSARDVETGRLFATSEATNVDTARLEGRRLGIGSLAWGMPGALHDFVRNVEGRLTAGDGPFVPSPVEDPLGQANLALASGRVDEALRAYEALEASGAELEPRPKRL